MFSSSVLSCCQLPVVKFRGTVFTPTSWCCQAQSVTLWQRQRDSDMLFFRSWVRPCSSCVSWCTRRRQRYSRTTRCNSDTRRRISTPRRPIDPTVMLPITCDTGRQRGSHLRVPRDRRVESIGQHEATKSVLRELVVAPLPLHLQPSDGFKHFFKSLHISCVLFDEIHHSRRLETSHVRCSVEHLTDLVVTWDIRPIRLDLGSH